VLARLAAESGLDVKWESVDAKVRRRAVTLRMTAATPQRFLEVACGTAALVARFTGTEVLVYDPASAPSARERREVLTAEAASAWRRIFLHAPQDRRLPEAHLILGAVYECSEDHASALAEYRLVANRFGQAPAAGSALFRSALVRMELNDYAGASKDLQEVLDSQADPALVEQAHLQLGRAAMKAGQFEEAARSFRKLYYLDLSLTAKAQAALHLGKCLYAQGQLPEAAPWLTAYLAHSRQERGLDVREAAFLLARCRIATSQPAEAAAAFRLALAADKDPLRTAEITLELCRLLMAQADYVGALGALNALEASGLPQTKAGEALLLHAQLLRTIGLPRRGILMLQKAGPPAPGSPLEIQMEVELARCRVADGDLEGARAALTQALPKTPQGPEAQDLVCELAEICLRLGEARQTASLMTDLLRSRCGAAVRRRACQALAAARVLQHDYEGAALAYAAMEAREPEAPKP
jgi:tetratricopeptide (TPR) repeat protein